MEFSLYLLKKGYNVLQPINPNSSYDLVIEKDGSFTRLQVKYLTLRKGVLRVELDRPKRRTLSYKQRDVDAMGIYEVSEHKFYLIPIDKISTFTEFWLRVKEPKNAQVKNIHLAQEFEI